MFWDFPVFQKGFSEIGVCFYEKETPTFFCVCLVSKLIILVQYSHHLSLKDTWPVSSPHVYNNDNVSFTSAFLLD